MERTDALILSKIYQIEKEQKRNIYSGDVASARILPKSRCQKKLEEFRDKGYLEEFAIKGANTYATTRKGLAHMTAYHDIKVEVEKFAV
ncbi:MAG: hypothetical protein K5931_01980 [Lachnospiraceae bacterium]|nr:hypothetical protein [Lachnospiraceae bacterium]